MFKLIIKLIFKILIGNHINEKIFFSIDKLIIFNLLLFNEQ